MAATLSFDVTMFNAAVFLMGLIGAASLAAHSIAIQLAALTRYSKLTWTPPPTAIGRDAARDRRSPS
jgi:hypothetical protein